MQYKGMNQTGLTLNGSPVMINEIIPLPENYSDLRSVEIVE